jgi:hypothetical protein
VVWSHVAADRRAAVVDPDEPAAAQARRAGADAGAARELDRERGADRWRRPALVERARQEPARRLVAVLRQRRVRGACEGEGALARGLRGQAEERPGEPVESSASSSRSTALNSRSIAVSISS